MRFPHVIGQLIVTFVLAAVIVPLVVVLVPATQDPRIGYLAMGCVFAGVFGLLRAFWPRSQR